MSTYDVIQSLNAVKERRGQLTEKQAEMYASTWLHLVRTGQEPEEPEGDLVRRWARAWGWEDGRGLLTGKARRILHIVQIEAAMVRAKVQARLGTPSEVQGC